MQVAGHIAVNCWIVVECGGNNDDVHDQAHGTKGCYHNRSTASIHFQVDNDDERNKEAPATPNFNGHRVLDKEDHIANGR